MFQGKIQSRLPLVQQGPEHQTLQARRVVQQLRLITHLHILEQAEAAERLERLLLAVQEEQEQPELEPKLLLSQAKMEETPEQQLRLLV
jgi:hypothetical protein